MIVGIATCYGQDVSGIIRSWKRDLSPQSERLRGPPSLQYGYRFSFPSGTEFFMTCFRAEAWFVVNLTTFTQPVTFHIKCLVFQSLILTIDLQHAQSARKAMHQEGQSLYIHTQYVKAII